MKNIHIVSAVNHGFLQHLSVMIQSVIETTRANIIFHVLHNNIDDEVVKKFECSFSGSEINVNFIQVNVDLVKSFMISHHITHESYFRLMIPTLIKEDIEKVIYLDSDIVLKEDISPLWSVELGNYSLAAVAEISGAHRKEDLGIPNQFHYFNAGVLLINLRKWREHLIQEKALNYLENNIERIVYHDQDALNAILYDDWMELHPKWNVQTNMFQIPYENQVFTKSEIEDATTHPAIVHYTSASKPWHVTNNHPYKDEYWHYLQYTPFKDYQMVAQEFNELLQRKKNFFIFGAGILGEKLVNALQLQIDGFIDNSQAKWGKRLLEKEIYAPDILLDFPKEELGIIIVSVYHKDIEKQLTSLGFQLNIDFVSQL